MYSDNNVVNKSFIYPNDPRRSFLEDKNAEIKTEHVAKNAIPGPIPHEIPKLEKIDPESIYPKEQLSHLMSEAREFVNLEFAFAKLKKEAKGSPKEKKEGPPSRLKELRKTFISTADLNQKEGFEKTLKSRCALYYAWQEKEEKLDPEHKDISTSQKQECLEAIAKTKIKQRNAYDTPLISVSNKEKDQVVSYSPLKFTCVADEHCPQKTFEKNKKIGSWLSEVAPIGKELKKQLKLKIKNKIQSDIRVTGNQYGPRSFPLKVALEEFRSQLNKISSVSDSEFKIHYEVINEMVRLFDAYGRNNGILQKNATFQAFYSEVAKQTNPDITPLYHYSEEYFQKQAKNNPKAASKTIDEQTAKRIEEFLRKVCGFLENEVSKAQLQEKQEHSTHSEEFLQIIIEKISKHFEKLIKVHKNFSHNRFIDLFGIHSFFINNLHYALSKLEESQKNKIQSLVEEVLNPEITLLETKRHRTRQGGHSTNNHNSIVEINKYIRVLTVSDSYDMISLEAAHVIPFPALFARREKNVIRKNNLIEFQVSKSYFEQNKDEKAKTIQKDIDLIFDKYKNDPNQYIDDALELLMKLSLEESSRTVHIPSVFNQEVDGVSEKYIETDAKEVLDLLEKYKKINQSASSSTPEKSKVKTYSEKVYKYILGLDLFQMVKSGKKMEYAEVLDQEKDYIHHTKLSLAKRMNWLATQPPTLTLLVMAVSLCNVFYGIKNAEAKANVDYTDGERELKESLIKLQEWIKASV